MYHMRSGREEVLVGRPCDDDTRQPGIECNNKESRIEKGLTQYITTNINVWLVQMI